MLSADPKNKFYEIYLEKSWVFSYAASDKGEAFPWNSSLQIWHQILLFLLKYSPSLPLIPCTRFSPQSDPPDLHACIVTTAPWLVVWSLVSRSFKHSFIHSLSLHFTTWLIFLGCFRPLCYFLFSSSKGWLLTVASSLKSLVCFFRDPFNMALCYLGNCIAHYFSS